MKEYILPILIFLGFGALSGILLLIASKVLAVKTDETEAKITEALPGANCGGCGYSGCAGYAADGIDAVIAIDKNGAVSGISIIALGETPGLGSKINDDAFLQRFYGVKSDISIVKSEPKNENEVQGITGSTLSSKGMAKAVNLAVKAYSVMDKEVQPNE